MALKAIGLIKDINKELTGNSFSVLVKFTAVDTSEAQAEITASVPGGSTAAQARTQIATAIKNRMISDYGYSFLAGDTIVLLGSDFTSVSV